MDSEQSEKLLNKLNRMMNRPSPKVLGIVALGAGLIGAGAAVKNMQDHPTYENEVVLKDMEASVQEIDVTLSEHHVIGFTTKVDGTFVKMKEVRDWSLDKEDTLKLDNFVVDSSLCFKAGDKKATHYVDENRTEIHIDPADISVCSKEDVMVTPVPEWGGNFASMARDIDVSIWRKLNVGEKQVTGRNALGAELYKTATNTALWYVNKECGPKVFNITKDQMAERIADDVRRSPDEVVDVIWDIEADETLSIDGKSDLDEFMNALKEKEGWSVEEGAGECKIADEVMESANKKASESDK